jgi:hypothetical protein
MLRAGAQALQAQSTGASAAAALEIAKTLADWENDGVARRFRTLHG